MCANEDAPSDLPAEPHLLGIPPELRNNIYRLLLVEEDEIQVTSTGYTRDGLLNTCKQIRSEALRIYYLENSFRIFAPQFDSSNVVKYYKLYKTLDLNGQKLMIEVAQSAPNWANLIEWLRGVHTQSALAMMSMDPRRAWEEGQRDGGLIGVSNMMRLATQARSLPWSIVEGMLQDYRLILACDDLRWMDD